MEVELSSYIAENGLTLVKYFKGQKIKRGAKSGQIRNSYCLVSNIIDNNNNDTPLSTERYYITLVNEKGDNKDIMIFDNLEKFKKIDNKENPVWYKMSNGYVGTNFTVNKKKVFRYFHQHILDHYNTQDGISIDHINRCRTDNRLSNLRLANQSEQNYNQVRERGTNLINTSINNPVRAEQKTIETSIDANVDNNSDTETNTTNNAKTVYCISEEKLRQIKSMIPKYIYYRKPEKAAKGGTHGEHFAIEVKKKDVGKKLIRIRKKTSKSTSYSLIWKLILAIKIRYQLVVENTWLQKQLEIDNKDELADFADEELIVIRRLAKLENLQETTELIDLTDITTAPKYRLSRVKCSTCGKEVSKEALRRHMRLKHISVV
jgi:hypothetical protein